MPKIKVTEADVLNAVSNKKNVKDSEEYKKLLEELDNIAKKYEFPLKEKEPVNTEINLDRKTFTDVSDAELQQQAKDSLTEFKQISEKNINESAKKEKENVLQEIENAKQTASATKQSTSSYYDKAKQNAENDALKRGLSRSSIIINKLSAFDDARINELIKVDKALTEQIEALNDQINLVDLEKQKALEDFNIEYASKLNTKLAELKSNLQARKDEVTEYNNKIAQIEKEYEKDAKETNSNMQTQAYNELLDRVKLFLDNGDKITETVRKENFIAVRDFLTTLDVNEAIALLQNNEYLKNMLGYDYYTLLNYYLHL